MRHSAVATIASNCKTRIKVGMNFPTLLHTNFACFTSLLDGLNSSVAEEGLRPDSKTLYATPKFNSWQTLRTYPAQNDVLVHFSISDKSAWYFICTMKESTRFRSRNLMEAGSPILHIRKKPGAK